MYENSEPAQGPYDMLTGRELTDDEIAQVQATAARQAMEEHAQRVIEFERGRAASRPRKVHRMRQDLTGRQRHKRAYGEEMLNLTARVQASGLYVGIDLPRRTWCARLRELELHPERFEALRDRYTPAQRLRKALSEAVGPDNA
jgi:hypothetical protein